MILWCEFSTYLDRNEPESIEKVKKIINTILDLKFDMALEMIFILFFYFTHF